MIPLEKVEQIVSNYETLEKELASGDLSKKDLVKKSKEYSNLGGIISAAKGYLIFKKEKAELDKIVEDKKNDNEMVKLAENELMQLINKQKEYEKKLKIFLLPKDEADPKNAILEIRARTGGDEAGI